VDSRHHHHQISDFKKRVGNSHWGSGHYCRPTYSGLSVLSQSREQPDG